eukprot:NODE_2916_length_1064_cov_4.287086_g2782_i0.p1 GENE.NODE_2916_length_1064_cov_4.287086_g2782_i0~~NODE_2916_length_1064_cov_4.287086_g2782_i0.p1  ORF type:complete len:276 (+),score=30.00 NODE_2916_length_1064_cov_4.287086_g2782_i0:47-874(+)
MNLLAEGLALLFQRQQPLPASLCHALLLLTANIISPAPTTPTPYPPQRPYSQHLARVLWQWGATGDPPHLPALPPLVEPNLGPVLERFHLATPLATALIAAAEWGPTSQSLEPLLFVLLKVLGSEGVLRCLGFRLTASSLDAVLTHGAFIPERSEFLAAFREKTRTDLTLGAKALAKHCHRESAGVWWGGPLKGSEAKKNAIADAKLEAILSEAVWMNVHMLPHSLPCCELRTHQGYGARWVFESPPSGDGPPVLKFRGFLEPHSHTGHAVGWRH